jgi:hypothetical protein
VVTGAVVKKIFLGWFVRNIDALTLLGEYWVKSGRISS